MKTLQTKVPTVCLTRDELDTADFAQAEIAKARWELQFAEARGFMHCLAVFVRDEYDGLWERASDDPSGQFDWGRGQKITERFYFRDGTLVPDESWTPPPPEAEWEAHGLRCEVRLTDIGHRCGYVGVPETHPWFGIGYDGCTLGDQCPNIAARLADPAGWHSCYEHSPGGLVEVHGGLTYAAKDDDGWWYFGFDCAHAGDLASPEYIQRQVERYGLRFYADREGHHWTKDEVVAETDRLAEQLAATVPTPSDQRDGGTV